MRNPIDVLNSLQSKSQNPEYAYIRLYRNLYNREFYLQAYQNIYSSQGNMTAGSDGKTIDGISMERIDKIIASMKDHSYHPHPARRTYIKKANGKMRPLGIPSFDDKLVQEVVRMILESIYEPSFSKHSHGFRPHRSCHTALKEIQYNFKSVRWFIEGDIRSFFDTIDHQTMITILRRRIKDEYFISLIWKFLKAGYLENWKFNKTYSGTPQGSIISPILSNIYLHELDTYMEEYMEKYHMGKLRAKLLPYFQLHEKIRWLKKGKIKPEKWAQMDEGSKREHLKLIAELERQKYSMPSLDPMDSSYKRLQYVRYADDWLCGVIGSKDDAEKIKQDIKAFLASKLKLELSEEKTLITHATDGKARFLGYDICISDSEQCTVGENGKKRNFKGQVKLYVPRDKWQKKLMEYGALKIKYVDGKEVFIPKERLHLINMDDLEVLNQFNAEIRGIYNYYKIADNATALNDYYYIMKYSLFKTFAAKYKTRISKIRQRYGYRRFGVKYHTKKGENITYFYDEGFKRVKDFSTKAGIDTIPFLSANLRRSKLIDRLVAGKCEWCGAENVDIEMHHVKKLKDLQGKKAWEIRMIGRRRKTLALCPTCHDDLHAGRLD